MAKDNRITALYERLSVMMRCRANQLHNKPEEVSGRLCSATWLLVIFSISVMMDIQERTQQTGIQFFADRD